jgi:hypothetical protein
MADSFTGDGGREGADVLLLEVELLLDDSVAWF